MTEFSESLIKEGWYLSDEGISELKGAAERVTASDIIRIALDSDLRPIGKKFLPTDINSGRVEKLEGPCVLQVQKVRNISASKDHEESQGAPRMLRLQMTDGHTTCVGLEFKHLSKLSLNTPPGTKVKLLGTVQIKNGLLLLDDSKISVLGGEVDHMVEKWELQRSLAKHSRNNIGAEGGPPPFVPFGQKCARKEEVDSKELDQRKTLQSLTVVKNADENDEFEKQRIAAIAEVAKAKEGPRTFGGGGNAGGNLSTTSTASRGRDSNHLRRREDRVERSDGNYRELVDERALRDIMEMGFNREAARQALMDHNNNIEVALNSLLTGSSSGSRAGPVVAESNKSHPRVEEVKTRVTQFTKRLKLKPSGSGKKGLTEKQRWLLTNLDFLKKHVAQCSSETSLDQSVKDLLIHGQDMDDPTSDEDIIADTSEALGPCPSTQQGGEDRTSPFPAPGPAKKKTQK